MEYIYRLPFTVLEVPNLKLKRPSWFVKPSAMVVFSFILLSYFLVTGGIIYDVIVEPPSVGSTTDEHGHTRPVRKPNKRNMLYWVGTKVRSVCKLKFKAKIQIFIHRISNSIFLLFAIFEVAFMPYRVNGQYIMEGLASSFLFTLGGIGFIVLDQTHNPSTPKLNRILLICVGFISVIVSFATCWIFMRMKLPLLQFRWKISILDKDLLSTHEIPRYFCSFWVSHGYLGTHVSHILRRRGYLQS